MKPGGGDESVSLSRFAGKSRNQTEEELRFEVEQALFEEHLVEGDQQQRENGGERETGLLFRSHDIGGCGDCQKEGDCEVVAGRQVGPEDFVIRPSHSASSGFDGALDGIGASMEPLKRTPSVETAWADGFSSRAKD